jgi:hypothetical protein
MGLAVMFATLILPLHPAQADTNSHCGGVVDTECDYCVERDQWGNCIRYEPCRVHVDPRQIDPQSPDICVIG